ncbi:MAG: hypothetical protein E7033_04670 [Akkermansiaceae bacterium]|nr:hypothetical protein [Akkermansiaceae bacterium]
MNGFRIAILSLMVVVVALVAVAVLVVLPNQQMAYEDYTRAQQREADARAHEQRDRDAAEGTTGLEVPEHVLKSRENSARSKEELKENEEKRFLDMEEEKARRKELAEKEATRAREAAQATALGIVMEVDPEYGSFFTFKPIGNSVLSVGQVIAVRRDESEFVVCEAKITKYYEDHGVYSAELCPQSFMGGEQEKTPAPAPGNFVIQTPFQTAQQLRANAQEELENAADGEILPQP